MAAAALRSGKGDDAALALGAAECSMHPMCPDWGDALKARVTTLAKAVSAGGGAAALNVARTQSIDVDVEIAPASDGLGC